MTRKQRLLVVEDEEAIRTGLVDVFFYHGYEVVAVADGNEGLHQALTGGYDLIILDVMLPSRNGFDICDAVRQADREQPIIMLTAKVADEDIINGLKLGADDYIGKPFGIEELVLRVEAVLRRSAQAQADITHLELRGGVVIDVQNLAATVGEKTIAFTRREIDILLYLHTHSDRPVGRDELLTEVWGYRKNLQLETRTVDIHIAKLRRKVEVDPREPRGLVTVRGAGYRLLPNTNDGS